MREQHQPLDAAPGGAGRARAPPRPSRAPRARAARARARRRSVSRKSRVALDRVVELGRLAECRSRAGRVRCRRVRSRNGIQSNDGGGHAVQVEHRSVAGLAPVDLELSDAARGARRSPRAAFLPGRRSLRAVPKRPDRRRLLAIRDRLRREYGRPVLHAAPRARGRAGAHRALPEHERPQPRRGLRPPARALRLWEDVRGRRWPRSRTRSGPAGSRRRRRSGS